MFQAKREDDLTMNDIEKIMGILDYLLNIPELRDKILMDVKLMEATYSHHISHRSMWLELNVALVRSKWLM